MHGLDAWDGCMDGCMDWGRMNRGRLGGARARSEIDDGGSSREGERVLKQGRGKYAAGERFRKMHISMISTNVLS